MEFEGWTKRVTIYAPDHVDCYLKIGTVGEQNEKRFPHLKRGDVCYIDLTVSKQDDSLRVYEVLMEMACKVIERGGTVNDVAEVLKYQNFPPQGVTDDRAIPLVKSICDYIGRYLAGEF